MQQDVREKRRRAGVTALLFALGALWMAALVGPPVLLLRWRETRLRELSTAGVQADWEGFREDMRAQSGRAGPVQRKVPRSAEPPELVWLRDYPALAVIAWVTFAGVLGGFLALVIAGIVRGPPAPG